MKKNFLSLFCLLFVFLPVWGQYSGEIQQSSGGVHISVENLSGEVVLVSTGTYSPLSGSLSSDVSGSGETLSGNSNEVLLLDHPTLLVKIVEIYAKDTPLFSEYIGLQFLHSFSGSIDISGLGNGSSTKTITLDVASGEIVYITDNTEKVKNISGATVFILSSITLTDTGEPLEIRIGDVVYDKVIYSTSSSTQAIGCSDSTDSNGYRLCTDFILSTLSGYLRTPPPNDGGTGSLLTGEQTGGEGSGSFYEGGGSVPPSIPNTNRFPFRIEEIYPYESIYPEYIEIVALEKYSGSLTIQGIGIGTTPKTITIETIPGVRWILTKDPSKFAFTPFVLGVAGVSLTNEGEEIALFLPNGQEIDRAVYLGQGEGLSALFLENILSGQEQRRGFFSPQPPTPGYSREMVSPHIPSSSPAPRCGIYWQHTTPLLSDKKLNLQAQVDDTYLQNSQTTYSCERLLSGTDMVYITECNPSYLSFEPGLRPVLLRISKNNEPYCELSQQINLPGPVEKTAKSEPESGYYEGLYRKRKEKYESVTKQVRLFGFTISSSGEVRSTTKDTPFSIPEELLVPRGGPPLFRISSVLPNPKGKDSEGERLVLENLTEEIILSDDVFVVRGKTSKGLPKGTELLPGKPMEIVGDIGLPNSPTCIGLRLRNSKEIGALFCYPQLTEDESFTGGLVGFTGSQEQERLQSLSLVLQEDQVCIEVQDQEILCKSLPYHLLEAKQWKKDAKKLTSVQKKSVNLQEKYDLWREKYATLSKNNKKREAGYLQRNRELRGDIFFEKQQKEMFRGFYRLIWKKLGRDRTPIYELPATVNIKSLYDNLAFLKDTATMHVGPIVMNIGEVESWYDFYFEGKAPYTDKSEIPETISYLTHGVENVTSAFGELFNK